MKKIKRLLFILLFCGNTSFSNDSVSCNNSGKEKQLVYFVNGIWNDEKEPEKSIDKIANLLGLNTNDDIACGYFWNSYNGKFSDSVELQIQASISDKSFEQIEVNSTSFGSKREKSNYYFHLGKRYHKLYEEYKKQSFKKSSNKAEIARTTHLLAKQIKALLSDKKNKKAKFETMVLVGHSQGNFYIESAYATLFFEAITHLSEGRKREYEKIIEVLNRIRVVSIAPVSATTPNHSHIRVDGDLAIETQKRVSSISTKVYTPLESNFTSYLEGKRCSSTHCGVLQHELDFYLNKKITNENGESLPNTIKKEIEISNRTLGRLFIKPITKVNFFGFNPTPKTRNILKVKIKEVYSNKLRVEAIINNKAYNLRGRNGLYSKNNMNFNDYNKPIGFRLTYDLFDVFFNTIINVRGISPQVKIDEIFTNPNIIIKTNSPRKAQNFTLGLTGGTISKISKVRWKCAQFDKTLPKANSYTISCNPKGNKDTIKAIFLDAKGRQLGSKSKSITFKVIVPKPKPPKEGKPTPPKEEKPLPPKEEKPKPPKEEKPVPPKEEKPPKEKPVNFKAPEIIVTPSVPKIGKDFTVRLQGGSMELIARVNWQYGNKTEAAKEKDNVLTINSEEKTLEVKAIFFDKTGKTLGQQTKVIHLKASSTEKSSLTKTGIYRCSDYAFGSGSGEHDNFVSCKKSSDRDGDPIPKGQDGHYQIGKSLRYTEKQRNGDTCIKDKSTGLYWEKKVKSDKSDLRYYRHTYTWYNPNNSTNGGRAGTQNLGTCVGLGRRPCCQGSTCNTQSYVNAVNDLNYCGYSDWRLPTVEELRSLIDYSDESPAVQDVLRQDTVCRRATPNNQYDWRFYWSSTPDKNDRDNVKVIDFCYGNNSGVGKTYKQYIRLVRD